jgi:hypothetical protein
VKFLPLSVIPDIAGAEIRLGAFIFVTAPLPAMKLSSALDAPPLLHPVRNNSDASTSAIFFILLWWQ